MIQWKEYVYIDEAWDDDGFLFSVFDQFELTTYLGKHITSCEARMVGEDHGASVLWSGTDHDMKSLNMLHCEALFKNLRERGTDMVLDYGHDEDLHWLTFDVVDELGHKDTKRAAYRYRAFNDIKSRKHVLEVYACGTKRKAVVTDWGERGDVLRHLLCVALHDGGYSDCDNVTDMGFVAAA